ncbi:MAG: autotransporter outer membrane beta-barrel domain-containing protein [Sutterellaceae bacterium]|nr:autotransporter outer membrane beta-barrel domain-containing protein [Sutterellaceae bacterium]
MNTKNMFSLTAVAASLLMTTGFAYAEDVVVDAQTTYKEDVVASDNTTTLTVNGTVENQLIKLEGGKFAMGENGSIHTQTLDILTTNSPIPVFQGTIQADHAFIYRGTGKNTYDVELKNTIIQTKLLTIVGTTNETGLVVTNQKTLEEVDAILVESQGAKTGLVVGAGGLIIDAPITLKRTGTAQDARVEFDAAGTLELSQVTVIGSKGLVQSNKAGTIKINQLKVEKDSVLNLQTNGSNTERSTFELNEVDVLDGGSLRLSVYGVQHGANIAGNVNINMGAGAMVDFGGYKEDGDTSWKPDDIYITADSLTFNIADVDSGNKVYLTGVEDNLQTKAENIKVVADGANGTGNAQEDLSKLLGIVALNTKDTNGNVEKELTGYSLEQKASGIFDGATATAGVDGTLENIKIHGSDTVYGITEMSMVGLHIWRNEINDMNKRLGELRDSKGQNNGVWARVYTGQARFGSKSIKNNYTAFQFGYDHQVADGVWLGGAASWTDGDNDFANGGGDSSLYAFTGYGSWVADNGFFLDVTGKIGRMKNTFDIAMPSYTSSASYHTNAVSLSAEAGWRFDLTDMFYIEPQVEMMWGHVSGVNYATDSAVKVYVEQDSADALIGRAGFALGVKCPNNRGNAYVRASVLHDWKSEADFTFSDGANARAMSSDLGGTWYEFGIGANFNVTDQTHLYADVEASNGGEVDTDYRINFGVRYSF